MRKIDDPRFWDKVCAAGGVGSKMGRGIYRWPGARCYVLATVGDDGNLYGLSGFSERHPTALFAGKAQLVEVFRTTGMTFDRASRIAHERASHIDWMRPWMADGFGAHMAKLDLWKRAREGKIKAPDWLAKKAAS